MYLLIEWVENIWPFSALKVLIGRQRYLNLSVQEKSVDIYKDWD